MRRIFAIIILFCIAYFCGGWIAVYFEWLSKESYFSFAGIVGGLASVVSLFSFTKPVLTKTDLQEIEIDSIKSIAKTTEELNDLEEKREQTQEELGNLRLQKKEMELLVKKASLALFLKEQYAHHEEQIVKSIEKNKELNEHLSAIDELKRKREALNEEIESDQNVELLYEIMRSASRKQPTLDKVINDLPALRRHEGRRNRGGLNDSAGRGWPPRAFRESPHSVWPAAS